MSKNSPFFRGLSVAATKKEGNTRHIRKVYSSGDGRTQDVVVQGMNKEEVETEAVSPDHETEPADEEIIGKAVFRRKSLHIYF